MLSKRKIWVPVVALVALVDLSTWASAQSVVVSQKGTGIAVDAVPEIAKLLPKEHRERGAIRFGATSTNMPAQFTTESGDLVGVVVELYKAASKVLGVDAKFDVITPDAMQPGVDSGRYDVVTLGDTVEREKLVDIISVYRNGIGIIAHATRKVDPIDYKQNLCGRSVAVTKGTLVERIMTKVSAENCVAKGREPIRVSSYVDEAGVVLAVRSQQDEFAILELVVALAYVSRAPNVLKIAGQDKFASSGPAIKKGDNEFREAFHAALRHLVKIGLYEQILTKYGIADMKAPELPLNLAGSEQK